MKNNNFYTISAEEAGKFFETDLQSGLTDAEAQRRLTRDGYNEFTKKKHKSLMVKFLEQFKSFMIIVLLVAAVVSGVVGYMHDEGFADTIIILAIVVLNAVIGLIQEAKAEKSLEALEKLSAPFSKVVRKGQVESVPSRELVVGDVVVVETGDLVPADMRLTEAVNLKIGEASLTGESIPEDKITAALDDTETPLGDRMNMAYSSTIVTYGRGRGIVTATGMATEVGKIASMIQSVPDTQTPLQKKIDQLGKYLGIGALAICVVLFIIGVAEGRNIMDMFMTAVSLAAAAIPEGLPAVSTIVLAVGVQRLARKNAIVRHLPSVETLGSTSVICSDKTGTLTQNRMTVVRLYSDGRSAESPFEPDPVQTKFLTATILANDGNLKRNDGGKWETSGDPTETAFLDLGLKLGINKDELEHEHKRVCEVPFDSERKMMSTVNRSSDGSTVWVKGGLDEVLARCKHILTSDGERELTDKVRKELVNVNCEMAESALRVLAAAYRNIDRVPDNICSETLENDLVFIGMAGIIDPPRKEVKISVEKCRTAGIKPVMITGDHLVTASAIARSLDIMRDDEMAITGTQLDKITDKDLSNEVDRISVYARVSPEHKVRIVGAFRKKGYTVAMTGDGVNDAPALKLADIGVAMGITGTDVSKEASDVILADDNFATIVTAVEEGRRIYDNILKAVQFMLSTNIGEVLVIFVAIVAGLPAPLLPIQILWINLVTDSLPALALSVDPADPDVMERQPVETSKSILNRAFLSRITLQGVILAGLTLTAFMVGLQTSEEVARTMTFAVMAFTQISHAFNVRSVRHSAFRNMFSNKMLLGALAIVLLMMLAVIEIPQLHDIFHLAPLSATHWWWIVGLSIAPLPIIEAVKGVARLIPRTKR